MADINSTDDAEVVWVTIPLDQITAARLQQLSDVCHAPPVSVAASLLHDMLQDDEEANLPSALAAGPLQIN